MWIDEEMARLEQERIKEIRKRKKEKHMRKKENWENIVLLKLLILLIPLIAFGALKADEIGKPFTTRLHVVQKKPERIHNGVFFTCKSCRTSQWQDECNADIWGQYHCGKCGTLAE